MQWSVKYRPRTLDELRGQPAAVAYMKGVLRNKGAPSCVLITGPSGVGKTSIGRLFGALLSKWKGDPNENPDLKELSANIDRGIDDVRAAVVYSRYSPKGGVRRVMLVDEVHGYAGPAASALLKAVEDNYPRTTWILCTDQPYKLPRSMLNRGQTIALSEVPESDLVDLMEWILESEETNLGKKQPAILKRIAQLAYGIPRQAVQALETVHTTLQGGGSPSEALKMAATSAPAVASFDASVQFIKALAAGNTKEAVLAIATSDSCDGIIELSSKMVSALACVAAGGKPRDGFGWAATKAIGRIELQQALHLQAKFVAALDVRFRSNFAVPSEALLLTMARSAQ